MTVFCNVLKRNFRSPLNIILIILTPALVLLLAFAVNNSQNEANVVGLSTTGYVAVVDEDNSELSKALVNSLSKSYNIVEASRESYRTLLTEQYVNYSLVINEGFGEALINGTTPNIEGYKMSVSEYSYLIEATTDSLLMSYMALAQDSDPSALTANIEKWSDASRIEMDYSAPQKEKNDGQLKIWLPMFGMLIMWMALSAARPMMYDMTSHIYLRIGAAPITPWKYQLQLTLGIFVPCAVSSASFLVLLCQILEVSLKQTLRLLPIVLVFVFFSVGLSVMLCSLASSSTAVMSAGSPIITIFSMLGGLFWPLEFMPDIMQKIALFTPTYWYYNGITTTDNTQYMLSIGFILAFSVVFLLFGSWRKIQPVRY